MTSPLASWGGRGAPHASQIRSSSGGGPGMATMMPPSFSTHQPGAVPRGLGIGRAEGISIACLTLRSGKLKPRAAGVPRGGGVAPGGPDPAGDQDEVGALVGAAYRLGQTLEVIADGGDVVEVDAHRRQVGGEVPRIGVEYLAEQDLGAHGDDLRLHGMSIAAGSGQWRVDSGQ